MSTIVVTKEEVKAIKALYRLSKKWPKTLSLFGWSGTLCVFKQNKEGKDCYASKDFNFRGMPCDGGDPSSDEVDQFAEVVYE